MSTYFITGCSRGIGLEFVKQLLAGGNRVIASARDPEGSTGLMELCRQSKDRCIPLRLDVESIESITKARESLQANPIAKDGIDVLINNAGTLRTEKGIADFSVSDIETTMLINAFGPMRVTQLLLPWLRKSTDPKVINITSRMGSIADNSSGGYYAYRMSKAALNMFTKTLAVSEPWLTTLCLHPGWVKTDMGGSGAQIPPEKSVAGLLKVITGARREATGRFLSHQGETIQW